MVMGVETFPILDDVVLPPAKGRAARPRKSDVDPIQKEKRVSLPKSTRFDNVSDGLRGLFSTPSLMKGEDPHVYAELYRRVEEVVQPQDVWDQMMVYDITNHFWEQHRYRRCTGSVINCKRRAALEKILREGIGLNDVDTETAADTYFEVARLEEREVIDYATQVQIPKTRAGVVDCRYGDVGRYSRRPRNPRPQARDPAGGYRPGTGTPVQETQQAIDEADQRLNGKVRALAQDLPEEPSLSPTEPPP